MKHSARSHCAGDAVVPEPIQAEIAGAIKSVSVKPAGEGDGGLDDLFGGGAGGKAEDALDIPLAKEIQKAENAERARKIIVEVIESQKQIKKDSKDAGYLLDCCSKAQAALIAAVGKGLRPESRREGVGKQLDQIEMLTSKIRDWLDGPHAAD